uniref:Uncharacterized protein n=1 Tax=Ixodes ricinus TaxID=34613 RepID=A0A147BJ14_IXORI
MSPAYIQTQLPSLLNKLQPRALLNYMGLMALIQVAPFLSERLTDLRELFAKSFIGRTVANAADSSLLCIYSVEKLLPGCFSKAASALLRQNGDDLVMREWTSKLDSAFSIQAKSVAWIDQLSALLLRYRSKRSPISRFGPGDEPCSPSTQVTSGIPLLFYLEVSKLQHERKIRDIVKGSAHLRRQSHHSDLNTQAQYQPAWQTVYVPTALLNTSVPVTGTASAFHLPRFALRYYLALVEMLFENYYQGQVQVSFSNDAHRKLTSLLACLKDDLGNFPVKFNFSWQPRIESLPRAVLNRILALRFAYNAFLDQLHVRRVWGMDFRFDGLPELSAARLFFVYYALDNCESTGVAYDGGPSVDLPASYRVNMPLRYLEEFISAFRCKFYPISSCNVFKAAEIMPQSHG